MDMFGGTPQNNQQTLDQYQNQQLLSLSQQDQTHSQQISTISTENTTQNNLISQINTSIGQINSVNSAQDSVLNTHTSNINTLSNTKLNISVFDSQVATQNIVDSTQNSQISANTANLNTEIANRQNADNTLQNNINLKANQSDLTNEITNRTTADTTLQNNINLKLNITDFNTTIQNYRSSVNQDTIDSTKLNISDLLTSINSLSNNSINLLKLQYFNAPENDKYLFFDSITQKFIYKSLNDIQQSLNEFSEMTDVTFLKQLSNNNKIIYYNNTTLKFEAIDIISLINLYQNNINIDNTNKIISLQNGSFLEIRNMTNNNQKLQIQNITPITTQLLKIDLSGTSTRTMVFDNSTNTMSQIKLTSDYIDQTEIQTFIKQNIRPNQLLICNGNLDINNNNIINVSEITLQKSSGVAAVNLMQKTLWNKRCSLAFSDKLNGENHTILFYEQRPTLNSIPYFYDIGTENNYLKYDQAINIINLDNTNKIQNTKNQWYNIQGYFLKNDGSSQQYILNNNIQDLQITQQKLSFYTTTNNTKFLRGDFTWQDVTTTTSYNNLNFNFWDGTNYPKTILFQDTTGNKPFSMTYYEGVSTPFNFLNFYRLTGSSYMQIQNVDEFRLTALNIMNFFSNFYMKKNNTSTNQTWFSNGLGAQQLFINTSQYDSQATKTSGIYLEQDNIQQGFFESVQYSAAPNQINNNFSLKLHASGYLLIQTSPNHPDTTAQNSVYFYINSPNNSSLSNFIFNQPISTSNIKTNTLSSAYNWVGTSALNMYYVIQRQYGSNYIFQNDGNTYLQFHNANDSIEYGYLARIGNTMQLASNGGQIQFISNGSASESLIGGFFCNGDTPYTVLCGKNGQTQNPFIQRNSATLFLMGMTNYATYLAIDQNILARYGTTDHAGITLSTSYGTVQLLKYYSDNGGSVQNNSGYLDVLSNQNTYIYQGSNGSNECWIGTASQSWGLVHVYATVFRWNTAIVATISSVDYKYSVRKKQHQNKYIQKFKQIDVVTYAYKNKDNDGLLHLGYTYENISELFVHGSNKKMEKIDRNNEKAYEQEKIEKCTCSEFSLQEKQGCTCGFQSQNDKMINPIQISVYQTLVIQEIIDEIFELKKTIEMQNEKIQTFTQTQIDFDNKLDQQQKYYLEQQTKHEAVFLQSILKKDQEIQQLTLNNETIQNEMQTLKNTFVNQENIIKQMKKDQLKILQFMSAFQTLNQQEQQSPTKI